MKRTPVAHIFILIVFLVNTFGPLPAQAQEFSLPKPGVRVHLSPEFAPPILKGLKVYPDNPFRFDFVLDQGDSPSPEAKRESNLAKEDYLKEESTRLIKYFLASLTVPERDLWVNLSPYEKDRIVPESFGLTEMGRDLLAEDYMLKQITASLIYPEDEVGKKFWKRIYEEAAAKYGTTNIPVNTFNKVWIMPEKAEVYENAEAGTAYVVESKLKVMLEQDYLAFEKNTFSVIARSETTKQSNEKIASLRPSDSVRNDTGSLGSQIIREIVIPELTREVNEGQNFAQLRQVYNSLILAAWYKKKLKDSILAQVYADKNKTAGVEYANSVIASAKGGSAFGGSERSERGNLSKEIASSPSVPRNGTKYNDTEAIYQRYLAAFKKGVYNYIKEEIDPSTQELIPRKYFSGGMNLDFAMSSSLKIQTVSDEAMLSALGKKALQVIRAIFTGSSPKKDVGDSQLLETKEEVSESSLDTQKPTAPTISFDSIPLPENTAYFNLIAFLQAQKRLRSLSGKELQELMSFLGILKKGETLDGQRSNNLEEYYARFYEYLAQRGYSPEIIKRIKGNAEPDIALDRTVLFQSGSSKIQSVIEAVANSIDALGGSIGQFGMGVKQILAWLQEGERVEVFSKKQDGMPYRLVITRRSGDYQVAIVQSTVDEFRKAMGGIISEQGTVVNVIKETDIPMEGEGITLKFLEETIQQKFAYVKWLNLWTRVGDAQLRYVNGWEHRQVLAGLENLTHANVQQDSQNKPTIVVSLESRTLRMIDTGSGMDFKVLSRMFLPVDGGDKENKVITTPEEIEAEARKVSLVHDRQGTGTAVLFARNGEIIMKVSLKGMITNSLLQGQLMVDLGRLVRVSPARDKIILQRNQDEEPLKKGFLSLVKNVLQSENSNEEKVKILNTLVGGLEGIAPGNKSVSDIMDALKLAIKREMKGFVDKIRQAGAIILPAREGFDNFQTPQGRSVIFLNEALFDWRGSEIKQLKEYLGAFVLPIVLEVKQENTDIPIRTLILSVPFKSELWQQYQSENFEDIKRIIASRSLPVLRGDGYVIVPSQIADAFKALSGSNEKTQELMELMKILAEEDTANGYEYVLKDSRAFAADIEGGSSTGWHALENDKGEERFYLRWDNTPLPTITPAPYGPQDKARNIRDRTGRFEMAKESWGTQAAQYVGTFEKDTVEVIKKVLSSDSKVLEIKRQELPRYLEELARGEVVSEDRRRAKEAIMKMKIDQEIKDLAMISLPVEFAIEFDKKTYTLNDFEKACTLIGRIDENILFKYSGSKPMYVLLKVSGREIEKFWSVNIPFDVKDIFIEDFSLILEEKNGLRKIYVNLMDPQLSRVRLNVSSQKIGEWRRKLASAYQKLGEFMPEEDAKKAQNHFFDFFYGQVREKMLRVMEGKTSAEAQQLAIDALIDEISNNLLSLGQELKEFGPQFFEENIISLHSQEREDFYARYFQLLVQASTVDGMSTRESFKNVIGAMAYGWVLDTPEDVETGQAVYRLIQAFKAKNLKAFALLSKIVCSIQLMLRQKDDTARKNLIEQVEKIMNSEASGKYLQFIYSTFRLKGWSTIQKAIVEKDLKRVDKIGGLLVFLTSRTDLVADGLKIQEDGLTWSDMKEGLWLDQLDVWNSANSGLRAVEDIVLEHERIAGLDGETVERIRQNIRSKIEGLRESGGYAAELMQNFLDAMVLARQTNPEKPGQMRVKYYLDSNTDEFVEEVQDDGPGAPTGKELALLIRKSNKYDVNKDQRSALAGFFGTGKFTMYAGADSVEIISRGESKVYVFVLKVDRTQGRVKLEKIGWRDRQEGEKTGVTIRRNKKISSVIPALEQMFAESAWRVNAGFAVTDQDKLELEINNQIRLVEIKGRNALFEGSFFAPDLSSLEASADVLINQGIFRIWEHNDPEMPSQIVDKKGLRVEDIALKERFLELVPERIRRIVDKMGIVIQIPLALYESRNGFAQEEEYLPIIQRYVALGIYRALISKHLADESFTIDRIISTDFETAESYNVAFNRKSNQLFVDGRHMFDIVDGLNAELDSPQKTIVSNKELETLRSWFDGKGSALEKRSIKQFFALLEVDFKAFNNSKERGSLVLRRIKALMKARLQLADELSRNTGRSLQEANRMSDQFAQEREQAAKVNGDILNTPIKEFIVTPSNEAEEKLLQLAKELVKIFGIESVFLAKSSAPFSGLFSNGTVLLNQVLAQGLSSAGGFSEKVETIVHEIGHLLQNAKQSNGGAVTVVSEQHGFKGWTHDDEFSQMMKWASFFILSKMTGTKDAALKSNVQERKNSTAEKGGIDFNPDKMNLETRGSNGEGIRFNLDSAMIQQLQQVAGFTPVIIDIQPLSNPSKFLGINSTGEVKQSIAVGL